MLWDGDARVLEHGCLVMGCSGDVWDGDASLRI